MLYRYLGTCISTPTLRDFGSVRLFPGAVVELPENNQWVKDALNRRVIAMVEPPPPAEPAPLSVAPSPAPTPKPTPRRNKK
jgi:hypothetical protein